MAPPQDCPVLFEQMGHSPITDKARYKNQLQYWQNRLFHIQQAYYHQGLRGLIVFEGWDAAGKGGVIRRLTEKLDPRGCRVFPIGPPSAEEKSRHFLYRFWKTVPKAGTLTLLDRSHYGRVLVERVEKLIDNQQLTRAYQEINHFEQQLCDDDTKVIKVFLHISAQQQKIRFEERLHNPFKRWKLTEEDLHNRRLRQDYHLAINDMFKHTHTAHAPWHLINGEHKWFARVNTLQTIVERLEEGVEITPPPLDKALIELAEQQLNIDYGKLKAPRSS